MGVAIQCHQTWRALRNPFRVNGGLAGKLMGLSGELTENGDISYKSYNLKSLVKLRESVCFGAVILEVPSMELLFGYLTK